VKQFVNSIAADILMIDYLYAYIILVPSELEFKRGETAPKGRTN